MMKNLKFHVKQLKAIIILLKIKKESKGDFYISNTKYAIKAISLIWSFTGINKKELIIC